jgi:hypothetical protein
MGWSGDRLGSIVDPKYHRFEQEQVAQYLVGVWPEPVEGLLVVRSQRAVESVVGADEGQKRLACRRMGCGREGFDRERPQEWEDGG